LQDGKQTKRVKNCRIRAGGAASWAPAHETLCICAQGSGYAPMHTIHAPMHTDTARNNNFLVFQAGSVQKAQFSSLEP